ncbi:MAG: TonB-dependent receptor [Vicinamibacterales bacterium]|nr:TonB-dependent receptor [Vicinamibacterales bacterium]
MATAVLLALGAGSAVAQTRVQETVVVTGAAVPLPFETLTRSVRSIDREELARLPLASVADVLRLVGGVDVRARGTHGVQTDFALRGANFAQALVLVDGVRINNAQTGHHNGDWPVSLDQVERIEVLLGPGSSLYGADAFGGTINVITRRAAGVSSVTLEGGSYGLVSGGGTTGFIRGAIAQQVSLSASRSSGFEFDRDFRTVTAGSRTSVGSRTVIDVGVADKAFGANGFYGNSPSKEWTTQVTATMSHALAVGRRHAVSAQASYRAHRDRFLWDVRRPGLFENRHRTYAAVAAVRAHVELAPQWRVAGGAEQAGDWLRSSNLGDHEVARTGAFVELQGAIGPRVTVASGLRLDRYSTFGTSWNPSLGASAWVSSSVRLRASLARAFRVPSFTERFYRDPAHLANADLVPERAWGSEVAADWVPHPEWLVTATLFDRRERDVIDWVKARPQDVWQTQNIRRVASRGGEAGVRRLFGAGARVSLDYAFTDVAPEALDLLSKYTLDYARHGLAVGASAPLPGQLAVGGRVELRKRTGRDAYTLVDLRVSRGFGAFSAYVNGTNLLDADYQEIRGVNMPGRWLSVGFEWRPR